MEGHKPETYNDWFLIVVLYGEQKEENIDVLIGLADIGKDKNQFPPLCNILCTLALWYVMTDFLRRISVFKWYLKSSNIFLGGSESTESCTPRIILYQSTINMDLIKGSLTKYNKHDFHT